MGNIASSISYYVWLPLSFFFGDDNDAANQQQQQSSAPDFRSASAKKLETLLENSMRTLNETKSPIPDARCDQLVALIHEILSDNSEKQEQQQADVEIDESKLEAPTNIAYLAQGVAFVLIAGLHQQANNNNNAASSSKIKQRREKALDLFSIALKIHRGTYGDQESQELASSISNVGVACLAVGKYHEAINLLREALDIRKRLAANEDNSKTSLQRQQQRQQQQQKSDIVASMYSLGSALLAAKNPEAAQVLRQAIADYSNLPKSSASTLAKWEKELKEAEKL